MAEYANIPIINGLTDYSHPCQAMADYLTMLEVKGDVAGLKIAFIGDGNNVCHSLMFAGAQLGAHVWVATPAGYEPKPEAVEWALRRGTQTGGTCTLTHDPVGGGVLMPTWFTPTCGPAWGRKPRAEERQKVFLPYQVNCELFRACEVRCHLPALSAGASRRRGHR